MVILDVQMPDLDGWQVLGEIRADEALRDLAVILCTVKASPSDLTRGWEAGCDAYITKPFDIGEMSVEVACLAALTPEELTRRRLERRLALLGRRSGRAAPSTVSSDELAVLQLAEADDVATSSAAVDRFELVGRRPAPRR